MEAIYGIPPLTQQTKRLQTDGAGHKVERHATTPYEEKNGRVGLQQQAEENQFRQVEQGTPSTAPGKPAQWNSGHQSCW